MWKTLLALVNALIKCRLISRDLNLVFPPNNALQFTSHLHHSLGFFRKQNRSSTRRDHCNWTNLSFCYCCLRFVVVYGYCSLALLLVSGSMAFSLVWLSSLFLIAFNSTVSFLAKFHLLTTIQKPMIQFLLDVCIDFDAQSICNNKMLLQTTIKEKLNGATGITTEKR